MRIKVPPRCLFSRKDLQEKALICTFVVKRRINLRKVTLKNMLSKKTYELFQSLPVKPAKLNKKIDSES